ncbi:hypothetical protein Hanom_Chr11g01013631 [Helianthus anomalus]
MPEEQNFKRSLKFFKSDPDESLGDILSWGYLDDLKLVKTKNIQQLEWGPEVRYYESRLWYYIRGQARDNFLEWKPQFPKRAIVVDPVTGEKDITLHVKRPRCMKNMPLKEMERDFYKDFRGWAYDPKTCQERIALRDDNFVYRRIYLIHLRWLVNCSKNDIDCLLFNKIIDYEADKEQALQYQKSSWRDLELEEFLKEERHNEKMDQKMVEVAKRAKWIMGMGQFDTDQTLIESEEHKFPKWSKSLDGIKEYREWWINKGRHERKEKLAQREAERKQKLKERRYKKS